MMDLIEVLQRCGEVIDSNYDQGELDLGDDEADEEIIGLRENIIYHIDLLKEAEEHGV